MKLKLEGIELELDKVTAIILLCILVGFGIDEILTLLSLVLG